MEDIYELFSLGVQERIKQDHYLVKLNKLIDWTPIASDLKGIHVNEENPKGGSFNVQGHVIR